MQMTDEEKAQLLKLLETASRKGMSSPWWKELVSPLYGLRDRMIAERRR